ncbi:MAG: amidohydrolase family protein [Acidimicrobiaceae bacterium]|nr:amidohydrolase family protein [Acidimicrobiaceae bacterium]
MGDVLIRGGSVIDGTGRSAYRADIRVAGGRIVEIGAGLRPGGESELDASGAVVTPGFIDSHTHFDPSAFWDPSIDPMPQHGVTTVLMGNCSLSLAPLRGEHRSDLSAVFSYIEDLPRGAFETAIPWSWETYGEYRAALAQLGFGVNLATFIGHTPLRMFVMGNAAWERAATPAERADMANVLDNCLREGAFGLSSSFLDRDENNRLVPSQFADDEEFGALLDVLGAHDRAVEVVPDFTNQPDGVEQGIVRMGDLCGPRHVTFTWNLLTFQAMDEGRLGRRLLEVTETQRAAGVRVFPQVSPRPFDLMINWDASLAFMGLPEGWHQIIIHRGDEKRRMLEDEQWRAQAKQEWDAVPRSFAFPHREPEFVRFVSVARDDNKRWLGRTLADLVAERGGHPSDVLADWVLENDCAPGVVAVGLANRDPEGVGELVVHPATIVSASDAGAHLEMMCAAGDSTLLLTRHVRDRKDLTLEAAVHELTGRQADVFALADRGRLRVGAHADLTVFALDELSYGTEEFLDDVPGGGQRMRRPAGGYRYTVVDGTVVQEDGKLTGHHPGGLLDAGR